MAIERSSQSTFNSGFFIIKEVYPFTFDFNFIDLPTLPPLPSINFPPLPDGAQFVLDLQESIDDLLTLEADEPELSLEIGDAPTISMPSNTIDAEALALRYTENIDIGLPALPPLPSVDFPPYPIPDIAGLKLSLDELAELDANEPEINLALGGDDSIELPSNELDVDAIFANYAANIDLGLPALPPIPSVDFPEFPAPPAIPGDFGIDTSLLTADISLPSGSNSGAFDAAFTDPDFEFDAGSFRGPIVDVQVFVNEVLVEVA